MIHMSQTITIAILAMALVSEPPASEAGEITQATVRSEDEEAIRTLCLDIIKRFNRHEGPLAGDFTPDADFVNIYGMWRKGPAEIERRQRERMETVLREAKLTLLDLRIRFIRPDVAIVHQSQEASGYLDIDGKTMPPQRELSIRVLVKDQGRWLTTAFHNTIVRSVEPPGRAK
jgi:uncharacterized protein (TIGR02246 family)